MGSARCTASPRRSRRSASSACRLRDRGGRHRRRRRPAAAGRRRAGGPLLRRDEPRRSRPARPGRDPRRGALRRCSRHRPRPSRRRCDAAQPGCRHPADRQLPHRARRLRRPAQRRRRIESMAQAALGAFYGAPSLVLSPSPAADRSLLALGVDPARLAAGSAVSTSPASTRARPTARTTRRDQGSLRGPPDPGEGGRPACRELPAGAQRRSRLHLLLAGGGPEEAELRARLGERATFLGWLEGEDLARAYASADIFLFCSTTDTYGQVVLEAGASGLPVVAVAEGGPASLVENRHTGMLCRPDADHIAGTVLQLAASPLLRRHLGASAVRAVQARSWERALEQLAGGLPPCPRRCPGSRGASARPRRLSRRGRRRCASTMG